MPDDQAAEHPADSGIPTARNPRRIPVAEFTDSIELFQDKRLLLGDTHRR